MRRVLAAAGVFALTAAGAAQASFTQEPGSPFRVFSGGPYDVLPPTDFNGDGRLDVATINGDSATVSVLLRQAASGFALEGSPVPLGMNAGGGNYGTVADFDGGGLFDIAASTNSGHVSVLLRKPTGGFQLESNPPLSTGFFASSTAAGDFNRDGRADLAVTGYNGALGILLRNNPGGGFTLVPESASGGAHRLVVVAEFNGDGDPDLAITNDASHSVTIMTGGTDGSFDQEGAPIAVGNTPIGAVARDFNADGRTDLAVANSGSDTVSVLLRQSAGFANAPGSPLPAGDGPIGVATGDFNSDGVPDLTTANQTQSDVSVLLGSGEGRFAHEPGSPIKTDLGAADVAVGDFDADKRPDLAVSNIGGNTVTILLNTTPPPTGPPPPPPPNLDVDGDGVQRPLDCNDADPTIKPGAIDKPGDKIDQDCNGRDARFRLLARSIEAFSATYPGGRYTKFTTLAVKPVRRGDRLRLTCKGPGCEMRKKTIKVRKKARKRSLLRQLKGAELRKGAVVQLRVTRPATIGRVATWRIRAPKIPTIARQCLRPGAKKPSRCPR